MIKAVANGRPSKVSVCVLRSDNPFSHLQNVLREPEHFHKNRVHTLANQRSCAEEQEIDRLLFALDITADIIQGADEAGVCLEEDVLPLEFRVLHSAAMRSPASCERPIK